MCVCVSRDPPTQVFYEPAGGLAGSVKGGCINSRVFPTPCIFMKRLRQTKAKVAQVVGKKRQEWVTPHCSLRQATASKLTHGLVMKRVSIDRFHKVFSTFSRYFVCCMSLALNVRTFCMLYVLALNEST